MECVDARKISEEYLAFLTPVYTFEAISKEFMVSDFLKLHTVKSWVYYLKSNKLANEIICLDCN